MKRLKLSFAALIAIVAVALTFTANAGMFKHTVLAPEDFCYTTLVGSKQACTQSVTTLDPLACVPAQSYALKPLFTLSVAGRIPILDVPRDCPGNVSFCCAEIEAIASPICTNPPPNQQPQFNIDGTGNKYYRIKAVHCKF